VWQLPSRYLFGRNLAWTSASLQTTLTEVIHRFLVSLLSKPPLFLWRVILWWVRLITEDSRSYSDTPHSVRLLWTSDWPGAEISTWQPTTLTRHTHTHTHIHGHCKIRTRISSKRAVADPNSRLHDDWNRLSTPNPFKSLLPTGRLVNCVGCNRKVLRTEKKVCQWTYLYSLLVFSRLFPTAIMLVALFLGFSGS